MRRARQEGGPTAATFPSEKCLSSWVGACPGDDVGSLIEKAPHVAVALR
jgi:hypothetical protein